ncbi:RDD family protein [Pseudomonadota bacterium]
MNKQNTIDLTQAIAPGFFRRFAAMCYDGLLLLALLMVATSLVIMPLGLEAGDTSIGRNPLFRFVIFGLIPPFFFSWFWVKGGQTLGMRAWRLQAVRNDGQPLTWRDALWRYISSLLSLAAIGLGFFWIFIDHDKLAWHDRLSKTRLVMTAKRAKKAK